MSNTVSSSSIFDFIFEIYSNVFLFFFFSRLYFHSRTIQQQDMSKDDLSDDDASITSDQETELINVIIPLDDCLDCHVQLTHCQVIEIDEEDVDESEESTWSWEDYFNLFTAAYPSSQEDEVAEEVECTIAVYDENDFDPAIFLNANMYWIPR